MAVLVVGVVGLGGHADTACLAVVVQEAISRAFAGHRLSRRVVSLREQRALLRGRLLMRIRGREILIGEVLHRAERAARLCRCASLIETLLAHVAGNVS